MFSKLKQFKDLRSKAKHLQDVLGQESAEGSAGWGKVKIHINGNQQVTSVSLDPSAMEDRPKLEQLIKEAANDAISKIQKVAAAKLRDAGGLGDFGDLLKK